MERNMKNTENIVNLAAGCVEPGRKEKLFSEIGQDPESEKIYNKAKAAWAFLASTNNMPEYKIENSYKKLQARLNPRSTSFRLKTNLLLKYAAVLLLFLCTVPLAFYLKNQLTDHEAELRYTSVVAKYKQISEVILPDSSVVWLNSGSTLTYNNDYSLNNRDLVIEGEAYFDIRKNKKIPLTVSFNDFKVKVLGTKFNVSAYPDNEEITVALETGAVELLHEKNTSFRYKLKPGEIAAYDTKTKEVKVKETTVGDYTAWKDGLLVFRDTPLDEVIKILERKFNADFIVEDSSIYDPAFNATFQDENLVEVLDYIKFTCHINYTLGKDDSNKTIIKLY
ncbi:FecR family protein [Sunxiuqinia elliptica]|uniref:FecR family protein n=1 Tax=Sunxiuqinia elliptica TaxID=655355 RepID=A0A4R6HAG1_9BACT|nr:FecR family protein [Sunxiuqinia elliptica]TDO05352.1 FecR family protein [Sunxiuqinia elliptica]TDO64901.1 FecR family protein [Sunxiuqinia elliptica]